MRLALLILLGLVAAPVLAQPTVPSLYADVRARAVGDPVTIILAERTNAQRRSGHEERSDAGFGGAAGTNADNRFALDANFSSQAQARNQSMQSDLLTGTVTALVTEVLPGGVLRVEGERRLNVNGGTHYLRIEGLVRPADIRRDNAVFSYQIANAEVVYRQDGLANRFFRPGTLVKAGAAVLLVVAAVLGAS